MKGSTVRALGLTGVLALAASPAVAQHHRDGGGQRHDTAATPSEQHNSGERAQPRQDRQSQQPRQEQRQEQRAAPRPQEQRAVPRQDFRREDNRRSYSAPRSYSGRYYGPRYVGPRFSIAPRRYFRPYYVFRPRFSIGFGIWAGYPITYYDPYYYPYDYSYLSPAGPVYPPPSPGSVNVRPGVQPNQGNMGGLSFEITPDTAEVWVDGTYYGEVGQFTASAQPLGLPVGRHHVELREPGYEITSFDVDIIPGQVIPYQGQLQP